MIIIRTPFRISFFGGGTDYPAWFETYGGAVLATTIDKYCYISCRKLPPFFEHKHRIAYSRIETVNHIDEIQHPAVRAVLNWRELDHGIEIHHDGDLPARSGLGSSSSFTVGLLHALSALRGKMVSKDTLAKDAIHVEQNIIQEHVGSQDQISAAFGGFNRIEFPKKGGSFQVLPMIIEPDRQEALQSHLMLFFTGFSRIASDIAKSKIANFKHKVNELTKMHAMVDDATQLLQDSSVPITSFGELLHQSWMYKRTLCEQVTTQAIDTFYERARAAGAIGGKILGAGGGGFLLLFVEPSLRDNVRNSLKELIHVPFAFENLGSRVMLYQPNGLA